MTENELPSNLKNLWDKAVKSMRMQNYDYVNQLLLPIVKDAPEFLDARKALRKSQMLMAKGKKKSLLSGGASMKAGMKIKPMIEKDPRAAMNALEDVLVDDPSSKGLNELLYDAAMAAELPDVGLLALETLKEANSKDTAVLKKIAKHYEGQKKYQKAADAFSAITALDPADLDAMNGSMKNSTRASMERNKLEEGGSKRDEDAMKEAELQDRQHLTAEQIERRLEGLLEEYNENNENVLVVKKIANMYERQNDFDSAISYLEWALHLSTGDTALKTKITGLQDRKRDAEFEQMESDLAKNPDAPDAAEKRARLDELKQERLLQKVAYFRDQVNRNPTDPQLRFSLAEYLYATGQSTEAIPELQRAKNNPHVRTKALLMLGKCFAEKNMIDLAITQLQEAEKELNGMDITKKEVVYQRALLHERREEKDLYLEALKQIYEVDYGYLDVAKRVESSYE